MKKPPPPTPQEQFQGLIGLGATSARKNYYPELLNKIAELEALNQALEQRVQERTAELEHSVEVLRTTQSQLVEAEKMASLGALVAGVAHEINTPLGTGITAISLAQETLQALQHHYREGSLTRSMLETDLDLCAEAAAQALTNLTRTADLVQRFKAVAVNQTQEKRRSFALRPYIEEVMATLAPAGQARIRILGGEALWARTAPSSLTQILSHLVANSVAHGFGNRDEGHIQVRLTARGETLQLHYGDDGRGMDESVLARVFEPFFTTRRGQGNAGLGLHLIYNLVTHQLGGRITCHSEPGQGTSFYLQLPILTDPPTAG